jgi:Tfp pilus assembly protein PilE
MNIRRLASWSATVVILAVLFGFFLGFFGYRQGSHRIRDEAEMAALSAALESYYADNGRYPSSMATRTLRPEANFPPGNYIAASHTLYQALSNHDGKVYFEFSKSMLRQDALGNTYIVDPGGNPYGYSTAGTKNNAYDLWSTRGNLRATNGWSGNWQ